MTTSITVGGRIIGEVRNGVFVKHVRGSIHFLRKPEAIALDANSLKQAEMAGARSVKIIDTETKKVYQALIGTIRKKGIPIDRGHGAQIALPINDWNRGNEPLGEQLQFWK